MMKPSLITYSPPLPIHFTCLFHLIYIIISQIEENSFEVVLQEDEKEDFK